MHAPTGVIRFFSRAQPIHDDIAESLSRQVLQEIEAQGKNFFENQENLRQIEELKKHPSCVRNLIGGLNFRDTGLKQPCTALAIILKIGRQYPEETIRLLEKAIKNKEAPLHYLCELIYKINRTTGA